MDSGNHRELDDIQESLQVVESHKLANAFGKGLGYTLILIFTDRLGRIMLGLGGAKYIGKR